MTAAAFVTILIAAELFQIWLHVRGLYSVSADEAGRVLSSYEWYLNPWMVPTNPRGLWLPLLFILNGISFHAIPDILLAPRVLNHVLGLLTVLSLAWLAWELFRDRAAALLTALLAAFFAPRVIVSVVPLAEIHFAVFLVAGHVLLARWLRDNRFGHLALAAFLLALASAVRFEGWIFAAVFGLIGAVGLLLRRDAAVSRGTAVVHVFTLFLILAAFPAFWIGYWWMERGSPFGFYRMSGEHYFAMKNATRDFSALWRDAMPYQFVLQGLVTLNIGGAALFCFDAVRERPIRRWAILPAITFLLMGCFSLFGYAMPSHSFWRIPLPWSLLVLPFSAALILRLAVFAGRGRRIVSASVALLLTGLMIGVSVRAALAMPSHMDRSDLETGEKIQELLRDTDPDVWPAVYTELGSWHSLHVMVASRNPDAFELVTLDDLAAQRQLNLEFIDRHGVQFVLLHRKFADVLRYPANRVMIVYQSVRFAVYKILPRPEGHRPPPRRVPRSGPRPRLDIP